MRIAFVTMMGGVPWGGSEALWLDTANAAHRAGHVTKVFAYHTLSSPGLDALRNGGVEYSTRRFLPGSRLNCLAYAWRPVWGNLLRFKPDVVLINQAGTYDCMLSAEGRQLASLLVERSIPYVIISHANYEMHPPPWPVRQRMATLCSKARRIGFVSRRNIELAELQMATRFANACVVRNPVNLSSSDPVPWPRETPLRFAQVSRIEAGVKGHDLLLEVLTADAWRQREWQLTIFGTGPDEAYVRALVDHFGLKDRVIFAGHADDIRTLWQTHHLLLFPSRTEALPLAIIEAMLCARPVIATNVGGISEWIRDGVTGYLSPGTTSTALGETLERAWHNRDSWESIGRAAHDAAAALIDPAPGQSLLKLLTEAAASKEA